MANAAAELIAKCESETHTCGCDDRSISCDISPRYDGGYNANYDQNVDKKLEEWVLAKQNQQWAAADALLGRGRRGGGGGGGDDDGEAAWSDDDDDDDDFRTERRVPLSALMRSLNGR